MNVALKQPLTRSTVNKVIRDNRSLKKKLHKMKIAVKSSEESTKQLKTYIKQFESLHPEYIEFQYVKNIVVKFLALAHSLSEEQKSLCMVLAACLHFSKQDKYLIDRAYFSRPVNSLGSV